MATSRPSLDRLPEKERPDWGNDLLEGYLLSLGLAFIVGAIGGWFEAVVLLPIWGWVTFTVMPALLFCLLNAIVVAFLWNRPLGIRFGLMVGFINLCVASGTSFFVFFQFVDPEMLFR